MIKFSSKKDDKVCQQVKIVAHRIDRSQGASSRALIGAANYVPMPTTRILAPKVNDPDRRLIDAIGEDKSHSTKETLDDIKRIHQKEKNKKNNVDNPGLIFQSVVRYHLFAYKPDILIIILK